MIKSHTNSGGTETTFERSHRLGQHARKEEILVIRRVAELATERAANTGMSIDQARRAMFREDPELRRAYERANDDGD